MNHTCAIVLSKSNGNNIQYNKPTVLSEVLFKPILSYVVDACFGANIDDICVVTESKSDLIENYLNSIGNFYFAKESDKNDTDNIVSTLDFLVKNKYEDVLILYGDTPFITSKFIENSYTYHKQNNNDITVATALLQDSSNHVKIIKNQDNTIKKMIDKNDLSTDFFSVNEVNADIYWFNVNHLLECIDMLNNNSTQKQYSLKNIIKMSIDTNKKVSAFLSDDTNIILSANSKKELFELNQKMKLYVIDKHLNNGVEFISLDGVYISPDAQIGCNTVIYPNTIIKENVSIGKDCQIGPSTLIQDSTINDRVILNQVQCYKSNINHDTSIGPFVHIRPNSQIDHNVHIGDFVEIKNSFIGCHTSISHLTYIGDSDVGENVNFGCGVVTVNYDGVNKNRCTIKDGAFIGCNTNLVAPVTIGKNGYTGAGSTITQDVPDEALGIARARQENKKGFSTKKLAGRTKKV